MMLPSCDSVPAASSPGIKDEASDGIEYQDTEPFDDIIIADSPLSETQLEILHADTEVLDSDIDKVVLDSDDEGIQSTETVSLMNNLPSGKTDISLEGDTEVMDKRQLSPASNQSYVGYFRRRGSKIQSCSIYKGSDTGSKSIYAEATWKKQHIVGGYENAVECQAAMQGNIEEVAVDNRNWGCDGKITSSADFIKSIDVASNFSTADARSEREVPLSKCEAVEGREGTSWVSNGHDLSPLSYVDSQEPGEHSQANALSVVDLYLSGIDVGMSPDVQRGKVTKIVSPPSLFRKGSQALARQANLRSTYGKFEVFDWSGNKTDELAGFHVKSNKEGLRERSTKSQHFSDLNPQKDNNFGVEKLQMAVAHNEHKDSTQMTLKINETSESMQATELKSDTNITNQLDNHADVESFAQQSNMDVLERDAYDMFDVGLDTQMAAEAMEALMYVTPPSKNINAPPALENSPEDTLRSEVVTGASKCSSFHVGDDSEVTAKDPNRTAQSLDMLNKIKFSPSELDANENKTREIKKLMSQTLPVKEKNIKEAGSSKSVKRDSYIVKCRGKVKSSPFACSTRQFLVHSPQNVEGPPCNSRESLNCIVKEVDCLERGTKRRKLNSVNSQAVDIKYKLPKPVTNAHCGATNSNSKKQMQTDSSAAVTTSHLKLDIWTYPKRKRTHPKSEADFSANHSILQAVRKPRSICQVQPLLNKKFVESFSRENAGKDLIPDVSSIAEYNLLHAHGGAGVGKQLLKKISPRSPLMKELSRLGFAESLPEFVSKDLRRRRNMANVQVLFSQSLNDDIRKQQKKILARLGISVASCCSKATHFITDRFVRTRNMLEAVALGKPVVTPLWLENCAEAGCLVDEEKYILRDVKKEKEIGFDLSVSLNRARHHPLLKGQRVLITQSVKPCKEMIESLVKSVSGQPVENILTTAQDKLIHEDLLILSCEEDYKTCVPFLEKGMPVYNSELLLSGIVTQKLDYLSHQLFADYAKKNSMKVYSRRAKIQI
nr:PREDICTED: uncharacterized protein LOC108214237 isoform X3 [Daucus carota subsp. sativus]